MFVIYFKPIAAEEGIRVLAFADDAAAAEDAVTRCATDFVRQRSGDLRADDPYSRPDYGVYLVNLSPCLMKLNEIVVQRRPAGFIFGETVTTDMQEIGHIMASEYSVDSPQQSTTITTPQSLGSFGSAIVMHSDQDKYLFLNELRTELETRSGKNRDDD